MYNATIVLALQFVKYQASVCGTSHPTKALMQIMEDFCASFTMNTYYDYKLYIIYIVKSIQWIRSMINSFNVERGIK